MGEPKKKKKKGFQCEESGRCEHKAHEWEEHILHQLLNGGEPRQGIVVCLEIRVEAHMGDQCSGAFLCGIKYIFLLQRFVELWKCADFRMQLKLKEENIFSFSSLHWKN